MLLIRVVTRHELDQDDSQRPYISLVTVLFIFHAFRTKIKECAAESTLPTSRHGLVKLFSDPKIGQFNKTLAVYQHVVWFDISVHLFETDV